MKLIAIIIASSCISPHYMEQVTGNEYRNALQLIHEDTDVIDKVALTYQADPILLKSIVFPEYIRYNAFQGLAEESTLELMYVNLGSSKVDFSIGKFQMKPSFAAQIEQVVSKNKTLSAKYAIISYTGASEKEIRKIRIARLKDVKWQAIYVAAFIDHCAIAYELQDRGPEEQLKFLATTYNVGLRNKNSIEQNFNHPVFPYGPDYKISQFNYWEVSMDYFIKSKNQ